MSWNVDLFIVSKKPLQAIADDISYALNLPVKKMDSDEEAYILRQMKADLIIGCNNQANDGDFLLESYDIIVNIWSTRLPDWKASEEECRKIGAKLFEKLKLLYHTSLLLTENGQKRLLTFDFPL